ncbi:ABC transporter permease [Pseudalkalibacillus sp. SCS-8]|uniref:ABC transporter permease n=1 Tax=Pseudalkalibacillus nanhaiensis TaxID=3115291 RepID=UPI0032DBB6B6
MNVQTLWKQRANDYWSMAIRYLRYIGNSGFLFTVYVAILVGSFYYGKLLKILPEVFPAAEVITILLFLLVGRGKIRTFMKTADANFLLPMEDRLRSYIQKSLMYSFVTQSFNVVLIMLVLGPLYFARISSDRVTFLAVLVLLILMVGWNLIVKWEELRVPNGMKRNLLPVIRLLMILFTIYSLVSQQWILAGLFILGCAVLYLVVYRPLATRHTMKWERLIELENNALMHFYRVANMFVEVPQLNRKVRKRTWASPLINLLSKDKENVYGYMYSRAFIRSNDYFGIFMRLTIIGIVLLLFLPEGMVLWIANLLLLYMTVIQLTTLWPHYDLKVWVDLYPVPRENRFKIFQLLLLRIMLLQVGLFTAASFLNHFSVFQSGVVLITGTLFVFLFNNVMLYKQLSKRFNVIKLDPLKSGGEGR